MQPHRQVELARRDARRRLFGAIDANAGAARSLVDHDAAQDWLERQVDVAALTRSDLWHLEPRRVVAGQLREHHVSARFQPQRERCVTARTQIAPLHE